MPCPTEAYWLIDNLVEPVLEPIRCCLQQLTSTAMVLEDSEGYQRLSAGLCAVQRSAGSDQVQMKVLLKAVSNHIRDAHHAIGKLQAASEADGATDTRKLTLALRSLLNHVLETPPSSKLALKSNVSGFPIHPVSRRHIFVIAHHFVPCPLLDKLLHDAAQHSVYVHFVCAPRHASRDDFAVAKPHAAEACAAVPPLGQQRPASSSHSHQQAADDMSFELQIGCFENSSYEKIETADPLAMERLRQAWLADLVLPYPKTLVLQLPCTSNQFSAASFESSVHPGKEDLPADARQSHVRPSSSRDARADAVGDAQPPAGARGSSLAVGVGLTTVRCQVVRQVLALSPHVEPLAVCGCHRVPVTAPARDAGAGLHPGSSFIVLHYLLIMPCLYL